MIELELKFDGVIVDDDVVQYACLHVADQWSESNMDYSITRLTILSESTSVRFVSSVLFYIFYGFVNCTM